MMEPAVKTTLKQKIKTKRADYVRNWIVRSYDSYLESPSFKRLFDEANSTCDDLEASVPPEAMQLVYKYYDTIVNLFIEMSCANFIYGIKHSNPYLKYCINKALKKKEVKIPPYKVKE